MTARRAWGDHITSLLETALNRNDAVPEQVSAALAAALAGGGNVYAFGAGPSLSLASEMHQRAGSLNAVRPIWNAGNCGPLGDACLDLLGLAEAMAPTSTITGAALIPAARVGAAEKLVAAGHPPEVLGSVNRAPSTPN